MKAGTSLLRLLLWVGVVTLMLSLPIKAEEGTRIVAISAKRFEFIPNRITLKKGETVRLQLTSQDVTHGFLMKDLHIDEDIVPGKTTELIITPQTTGQFITICDHFCGAQHGNMRMTIVVEE